MKDQEFNTTYKSKISNKDIDKFMNENSVGTIFYPIEETTSRAKIRFMLNTASKTNTPVLFSRSTYPYKTIGLLLNSNFDENSSNSIAFDLASAMSANLVAININQPKFLQQDNEKQLSDTLEKLQDLALSHEVQLDIETHEGNEAKIFSEQTSKFDLSIISSSATQTWQGRKIVEFVSKNSKCSVLYIPG
jgi:hypothetical protein